MATRLQLASGYDARLRRDGLPRPLRERRAGSNHRSEPFSGVFAAESRSVLRAAAIISALALGGFGIIAVALVATLAAP